MLPVHLACFGTLTAEHAKPEFAGSFFHDKRTICRQAWFVTKVDTPFIPPGGEQLSPEIIGYRVDGCLWYLNVQSMLFHKGITKTALVQSNEEAILFNGMERFDELGPVKQWAVVRTKPIRNLRSWQLRDAGR
jgi:hypothetical protein